MVAAAVGMSTSRPGSGDQDLSRFAPRGTLRLMPDHGGTPAPWSESEIDALADFVADQEAPVGDGAGGRRRSLDA